MPRSTALTARELQLWQAWSKLSDSVAAHVAREVAEASGLSAAEYAVLERLTTMGNGRLRQRELAAALDWDKSRISHQLTRMQERGLLTRSKSVEAGSQVAMTRAGSEAFALARPAHAQAVRRHLIQRLTADHAAAILNLAAGL